MRNLKSPSQVKKDKQEKNYFIHSCDGLQGLTAFYAFSSKGLLKIINKFVDEYATGFYRDGKFFLVSIYTKEEILDSLVRNYKPSFVPVWSRVLFEDHYFEKVEQLRDIYPDYYSKVLRSKISIEEWLTANEHKPVDIKGDVLVNLFHSLKDIFFDKDIMDYVKTAGIPYKIKDYKGREFKKLWYSPLWNKSLGRFGKGSIFTSYLNALKDISKESWDAAIFGTPHPNMMGEYPIFQFDLKNWGGSREGKIDKKRYSLGIGVNTGEKSLGTAADVLMIIESLTFFRGFLGEEYTQNRDESEVSIKSKPRFSLCVRNTSSSFHTGLMSEMSLSHAQKNLIGVEEIFVPIWSEPLTFTQAQERLSMTAEMPVETFINTSKDLMGHLAQHATQTGIDSYVRFASVARGGTGFSSLHFLIPVEEFYPKRSRRNDIISPFVPLYNELLYRLNKTEMPYTLRSAAQSLVNSIGDFSISRSTVHEIMYSFLELKEAVNITSANLLEGKLSKNYLSKFTLPDWWIMILERGTESAELRIGKSIARQRQLCFFDDISELVQGNLNTRLINAYSQFIAIINDDDQDEIIYDTKCWLPVDFLITYKFHSYKKYGMDDEKLAWSFFFENDDLLGAMSIALDTLYSRELIKDNYIPFVSTEKENIEIALRIPLSKQNQRKLRMMIK